MVPSTALTQLFSLEGLHSVLNRLCRAPTLNEPTLPVQHSLFFFLCIKGKTYHSLALRAQGQLQLLLQLCSLVTISFNLWILVFQQLDIEDLEAEHEF